MIERKLNRYKDFNYSANQVYFITNCVKDMKCCLGEVIPISKSIQLPPLIRSSNYFDFDAYVEKLRFREAVDSISIHNIPTHNIPFRIPGNFKMVLNEYGKIVEEQILWLQTQYPYVVIHHYTVMPNHIHLMIEINSYKINTSEPVKILSVSNLIGALKTTSSKKIHQIGFKDFKWHRSFHDHIIRTRKAYLNIFYYISDNHNRWFKDCYYSRNFNY
jgi:putative transposase